MTQRKCKLLDRSLSDALPLALGWRWRCWGVSLSPISVCDSVCLSVCLSVERSKKAQGTEEREIQAEREAARQVAEDEQTTGAGGAPEQGHGQQGDIDRPRELTRREDENCLTHTPPFSLCCTSKWFLLVICAYVFSTSMIVNGLVPVSFFFT